MATLVSQCPYHTACSLWDSRRVLQKMGFCNKLTVPGGHMMHIGPQFSRCSRSRAARTVATSETRLFKVTLQTPAGEKTIEAAEDVYLLDAAESAGISLPVSCRSGNCSSCAAILKSGEVDQSYQMFLSDEQVSQGFILTCAAYPLSDVVVETHQEARLYAS